MFENYRQAVKADYESKCRAGKLPALLQPTRAEVKRACIIHYTRGSWPSSENGLHTFFGAVNDGENYGDVINRADPDDFRSVSDFFREEDKEATIKTVELAAWLIEFQKRPYVVGSWPEVPATGTTDPPQLPTPLPDPPKKIVITLSLLILLAVAGGIAYPLFFKNNNCMQWKTDHFEQVACDEITEGIAIVPLDEVRLDKFKKISRSDTLTASAIGNVWYSKKKGELEFFTANGDHPTDRSRDLRPLAMYMFEKYILSKRVQGKK